MYMHTGVEDFTTAISIVPHDKSRFSELLYGVSWTLPWWLCSGKKLHRKHEMSCSKPWHRDYWQLCALTGGEGEHELSHHTDTVSHHRHWFISRKSNKDMVREYKRWPTQLRRHAWLRARVSHQNFDHVTARQLPRPTRRSTLPCRSQVNPHRLDRWHDMGWVFFFNFLLCTLLFVRSCVGKVKEETAIMSSVTEVGSLYSSPVRTGLGPRRNSTDKVTEVADFYFNWFLVSLMIPSQRCFTGGICVRFQSHRGCRSVSHAQSVWWRRLGSGRLTVVRLSIYEVGAKWSANCHHHNHLSPQTPTVHACNPQKVSRTLSCCHSLIFLFVYGQHGTCKWKSGVLRWSCPKYFR